MKALLAAAAVLVLLSALTGGNSGAVGFVKLLAGTFVLVWVLVPPIAGWLGEQDWLIDDVDESDYNNRIDG